MRVIGGSAGGRTLKGPKRAGTRPTSDLVRGVIFELIAAHCEPPARVLDLYSGTGAIGIEALSRGAEHCDFVEADAKACAVIRENLALTGLGGHGKVYPLAVAKAVGRLAGPYDLVVADPPYEYDRAEADLERLVAAGLLDPEGALVVEHSKRHLWPEELAGRQQLLDRRHGDTRITIYR